MTEKEKNTQNGGNCQSENDCSKSQNSQNNEAQNNKNSKCN